MWSNTPLGGGHHHATRTVVDARNRLSTAVDELADRHYGDCIFGSLESIEKFAVVLKEQESHSGSDYVRQACDRSIEMLLISSSIGSH